MVKRVDTAVFDTIKEAAAGHWTGGVQSFGLKEDGVGWVYDEHNKALVPDAVKARVDSLRDEIIAGKIHVPSE
jgi:basic membrane protein A